MQDTDKKKAGELFVWSMAAVLCVIAAIYYWAVLPTKQEPAAEAEVTTEAATVIVEATPSSETEEGTTEAATEETTTEETTTEAATDMPSGVIGE